MKYLFLAVLVLLLFTNREAIREYLSIGQEEKSSLELEPETLAEEEAETCEPVVLLVGDSVVVWDETFLEFTPVRAFHPEQDEAGSLPTAVTQSKDEEPIKLSWETLTQIEYILKYYEEVDMEMYAPIFPSEIENLAGKQVTVKGYVMPFDETGAQIVLSANPFASCFFCGKASPASVMTLHLFKHSKKHKMDDYLEFSGRLRLNYDDPKEFYYLLEEAKKQ